ncbi:MAG: hypothetical protein AAGC74_11680 [Verrucomicrobiota bacterium]
MRGEETQEKRVIRDLVSRAELEERRAKRSEAYARFEKAKEHSGMRHPSQASLIERSIILTSGSHWTIVPKGAVILVPERYEGRVDVARSGQLMKFPDFLRVNRGWLSSYEVTLEQARGNEGFEDEVRQALEAAGRVVVATRHGGPITILEGKRKEVVVSGS